MRRGLGFHARHSPGGAFSPLSLFAGGTVQGAWYDPSDSTTLFSDRAGTTPCGTPGGGSVVPVGSMLDKRAAGYSVFFDGTGDYLTVPDSADLRMGTGDFTVEFWIYFASISGFQSPFDKGVTGSGALLIQTGNGTGRMIVYASGSAVITESGTGSTGTWIHYALVRNAGTLKIYRNGTETGSVANSTDFNNTSILGIGAYGSASGPAGATPVNGYISNLRVVKGIAVYTGAFTPAGPLSPITGTSLLTCGTSWTGNPAITKNGDARVDGLNPFQASPVGNHAIAANDTTARPELRARVNLLTYSEQFDNAAWVKDGATAANTTATTDPLGGTTAEILTATLAVYAYAYQIVTAPTATVVFSCYVKAATASVFWLYYDSSAPNGTAFFQTDLTTQAVAGFSQTPSNLTITSVGNGWFRISAQWSSASGSRNFGVGISDAKGSAAVTIGRTGYVWGAQLTATNEFPANTYQRISDANTYDAVGFPRYLVANGTSSAMSTPGNVNLSGTDKVTVFAGVRKLAEASYPTIVEFSVNSSVNTGSFSAYTSGSSTPRYPVFLFGTASTGYEPQTYAAPISNVLAVGYDIGAADRSTEVIPRINGVVNQTNPVGAAAAGTGNFGSYPLFIGARNNASLFLNGNIYGLTVVGSALSAGQITQMEQWLAGKTGISI